MDEFKSNSHRVKEEKPERKKIEKVVTGVVKTKKKSSGRKIVEDFISEDMDSVKSHILSDVLVPALKDMFYDAVTSGLSMLLGGEGRSTGYRGASSSRESYNKYYKQKNNYATRAADTPARSRNERYSYDDIILDSRAEAEEVLDVLDEYLTDFGMVSLLELYEAVGKPTNYMDSKYGWFDLKTASVARTRDGYLLKLPRIQLLD